jgi:DNA-binding FrmR family transcriptional regulator
MDIKEYNSLVGSLASEFRESGHSVDHYFQWAIHKQNTIYELPINVRPTLAEQDLGEPPLKRIQGFMKTLQKEMEEGREIELALEQLALFRSGTVVSYEVIKHHAAAKNIGDSRADAVAKLLTSAYVKGGVEEVERQILVMIADWLGDQNVYLRSEALKFGLPHEAVLNVIMGSNFTKLGEDGNPIKDENGKFLKGPNYVAPEGHIYTTLFGLDDLVEQRDSAIEEIETTASVLELGLTDPMLAVISNHSGLQDETYLEGEYWGDDEDSDE